MKNPLFNHSLVGLEGILEGVDPMRKTNLGLKRGL